jgi:hypothetical protein
LLRDARIYAAAVARLVHEPFLPVQASMEVEEVRVTLERLQSAAGDKFDIGELVDQAARLRDLAQRIERRRDELGESASSADVDVINDTLRGIMASVLPAAFSVAGPFGHDPALSVPEVPGLAPMRDLATLSTDRDEARFLRVGLRRERNRVLAALNEGINIAQRGITALNLA